MVPATSQGKSGLKIINTMKGRGLNGRVHGLQMNSEEAGAESQLYYVSEVSCTVALPGPGQSIWPGRLSSGSGMVKG